MKIDKNYILTTLQDLVRINSINPRLSPDGEGETEIGAYVGLAGVLAKNSYAERMKGTDMNAANHAEPLPHFISSFVGKGYRANVI